MYFENTGRTSQYAFDVSEENNDLGEVDSFIKYDCRHADYGACNRQDSDGHLIYNIRFTNSREAVLFKLMFKVSSMTHWDEFEDEVYLSSEELSSLDYKHIYLEIPDKQGMAFREWCSVHKVLILEEMKFFNSHEPFNVFVKPDHLLTLVATWGREYD